MTKLRYLRPVVITKEDGEQYVVFQAADKVEDFYSNQNSSIKKYIAWGLLLTAFIFALLFALSYGLSREEARLDAEIKHNCTLYGDYMNHWAEQKGIEKPCN